MSDRSLRVGVCAFFISDGRLNLVSPSGAWDASLETWGFDDEELDELMDLVQECRTTGGDEVVAGDVDD